MSYFSKALIAVSAITCLSAVAAAQANPPVWSPTASYQIGNVVSYEGIDFQCIINETTNHPNPHEPGGWAINYVYGGNVSIPVGPTEPCNTLTNAWSYIKYARIAAGLSITLSLQTNYNEKFGAKFSLDHPYGAQIHIVGNNSGQIATFTIAGTGFILDSGCSLAELSGLKILNNQTSTYGAPAILVQQKALLAKVSNLTLQGFDLGLEANSAEIDNVSAVTFHQFISGGVLSTGHGAMINFSAGVTVDGNNTINSKPPVFGFQATYGGGINCSSCTANNCARDFWAVDSGNLYCTDCSASSPAATGYSSCYSAYGHGNIYAASSTATGALEGYDAALNSYIDATGSSASGYTIVGYAAANLSGVNAPSSQSGSATHDSTSYVIT